MPDDVPSECIQPKLVQNGGKTEPIHAPPPPDNPPTPPAEPIPDHHVKAEVKILEDRVKRAEWLMIGLTFGIVLLTLGLVIVGVLQWRVLSGQLSEMKSGGVDTHNLADAAQKQASKTETLATETHTLAVAANNSASAAKDANDIARTASRSVQRAFIVVDHLEIMAERTPSGAVARWIVNPVITNSGNTPTKNLFYLIGFGGEDMTKWPKDKQPPMEPPNFPTLAGNTKT